MNSVTVAQAKAHLATIQALDRPKKPIDMGRIDAVRKRIPNARTPALDLIRAIRAERG